MSDSHETSSEEEEEEEEEVYPPWLENIVKGEDHYDHVRVLSLDEKDASQPGYVRCQEVEAPDAADAAERKDPSRIRRYKLKRLTPVLIVAAPADPPYIGLIDKIWLKKGCKPVPGTTDTYTTGDFKLECYWFYRCRELPANTWARVRQPKYSGAEYRTGKRGFKKEQFCERQVLFSSHHTRHDYPDDNGLLSMEGFLQTCKLHWKGLKDPPPERYMISSGRLVVTREPGFVVQGFLWCGAKDKPQYHPDDKIAHRLDDAWGDLKGEDDGRETKQIVDKLLKRYKAVAKQLKARNDVILQTAAVYGAIRSKLSPYKELSDDDGDPSEKRQQQREQKLQEWQALQQQQQ